MGQVCCLPEASVRSGEDLGLILQRFTDAMHLARIILP